MTVPPSASRSPNAEQIEAWNGPTGAKWVHNQERLDRMLAPFSEAVLAAAASKGGERVLDIGCGCGATTLELAARVAPSGKVTGIDISAPMIARAHERAATLSHPPAFELADASVHRFAPASFDLLFSRFGVMFFDDPVAAFANLASSLAPDGRLVFICWRALVENAWLTVPLRAALPLLPPFEPMAPDAPGPFAFADSARVISILERAGLRDVKMTPFDAPLRLATRQADPVEEALAQALEIGPLSRLFTELDETVRRQVEDAVRAALAEHLDTGGIALGGAAWIATARR